MPLQKITYNELIDATKNYIKTNCSNIANYSGMESCFKSGYTISGQIAGNTVATSNYKVTIVKSVAQVNTSVVDTDFNNFLSKIGASSKLSDTVSANNFFNIIQDIISFCSTKLAFATSQYSSNTHLIYCTENTTYQQTKTLENEVSLRLIKATDVQEMLSIIVNITKQNIRSIPCTYTITLS